ncbi:MAG: M17 family peptidase N-terminal domain-containing protein, partial [Edaphobacter sp.]
MDTKLFFQDAVGFAAPMLAVFAVDIATGKESDPLPALLSTSDAVAKAAAKVMASGEFTATLGETLLLHAPGGLKAERLLLVGLGKAKTLSADEVRKGAGTAVRAAKPLGLRELAIAFPDDQALSDEPLDTLPCRLMSRALVEGAELGEIDYDTYRSDRKDKSVRSLSVIAKASEKSTQADIEEGFNEGLILARAQNFTRSLVNEPGNVLTPTVLGERAAAMCSEMGLKCEVYST